MEDNLEFNVFDEISRNGYIYQCKGFSSEKMYTAEEMKEMLLSSGMNIAEIKMLYVLNHEAAMAEIEKLAGQIDLIPVDEVFSDSSWVRNEIEDGQKAQSQLFCMRVASVITMIALLCFFMATALSLSVFIATLAVGILTYVVMASFYHNNLWKKVADSMIRDIKNRYIEEVIKPALRKSKKTAYSIANTIQMYEVMEKYVENYMSASCDNEDNLE